MDRMLLVTLRFRNRGLSWPLSPPLGNRHFAIRAPYQRLTDSRRASAAPRLSQSRTWMRFDNLERRTARGGRGSIDHAPAAHDDSANAACGALVLAAPETEQLSGVQFASLPRERAPEF